jgi:hypothetical protein
MTLRPRDRKKRVQLEPMTPVPITPTVFIEGPDILSSLIVLKDIEPEVKGAGGV